jgi:uncharacterized membrane protein
MLHYFIIFSAIGLVLGFVLKNKQEAAISIIIGTSVIWGLTNAVIWGFTTFGELMLGFIIAQVISNKNKDRLF